MQAGLGLVVEDKPTEFHVHVALFSLLAPLSFSTWRHGSVV